MDVEAYCVASTFPFDLHSHPGREVLLLILILQGRHQGTRGPVFVQEGPPSEQVVKLGGIQTQVAWLSQLHTCKAQVCGF